MPGVDLTVVGKKTEPVVFNYTWKDVVLYALGVGAKAEELHLVYENYPDGLSVLPSFCVVPAMKAFPSPGDDVEWSLFLHGEQCIRISRPIPPEGTLVQIGEIRNIYDKGKGAVYDIIITGRTEDGEHVYDAEWTIFYLGAGGFGGEPGPKAEKLLPPKGFKPDFSIEDRVAENLAALYRLSGDTNPLHIDPEAAKRGGFDRPILHGLCTFGFATRAIVEGPLEGDTSRLKEFRARFSNSVYPGDVLTTECWRVDGDFVIQVRKKHDIVMTNAIAKVR